MRKASICSGITVAVFLLAAAPAPAVTLPYCVEKYVEAPSPVGQGRMRFFIWDLYDATLYAPRGDHTAGNIGLTLHYLRRLEGRAIADASADEMRKTGVKDEVKLAEWHSRMRDIFPDVDAGVSLTGVVTAEGQTIFCRGQEEIGRVADPAFGNAFFGIWLDSKTSQPGLRRKLLGKS